MIRLVCFVEEPSAAELLAALLPRILPAGIHINRPIVFEGKQDLERNLQLKLRAWRVPDTRFVVLRDQDSADCVDVKAGLARLCREAGRPNTLVRVACHELESWYMGDLAAVGRAYGIDLGRHQNNSKFRDPDRLNNAAQELIRLSRGRYQKKAGSRAIAPHLDPDRNRSASFAVFCRGVQRLVGDIAS